MKKGYFIISEMDFVCDENNSIGVHKKINNQYQAFLRAGYDCKLINLGPKKISKLTKFLNCFKGNLYKKINLQSCDFLYIRRIIPNDKPFIKFLKRIKILNPEVKIIYEVPTFPYDSEHKTKKQKISLLIDKYYRKYLHNYVDLFTTYSKDTEIFGVKALPIQNGINVKSIPLSTKLSFDKNVITLIAVAQFREWHGFDRLIEGLNIYYKNNPSIEVRVLFVGQGESLSLYKDLVLKYNLIDHIDFMGMLSGEKLSEQFNKADIGVCSLGCHRINIFLSSVLKSREYLARGLPLITSTPIDIIPKDFKYCCSFSEDESPIDINNIIDFYFELTKKESIQTIHNNIRIFAENTCDIKVVMKPIFDFIEN